jgi:hypothetical protein
VSKIDAFTRAYIECALWSSTDNSDDSGGEPLDRNYSIDDIAPATLATMVRDCAAFQAEHADNLAECDGSDEYNGHDLWLTRNGHGAGFWDRGYGPVGDRLTAACKACGSVDLYVGDDGLIHSS